MNILTKNIKIKLIILTILMSSKINAQHKVFAVQQDTLIEKILHEKNKLNNTFSIYKNYSVQLFYGKREEAQTNYSNFKHLFPEVAASIIYNNLKYKLVAGNYKNKIQAAALLRKVRTNFPDAFIIRLSGKP